MCLRKIFIKNMVCDRCIKVMKDILKSLDLRPLIVRLGTIEFEDCMNNEQKERLRLRVEAQGFEIIEDRKSRLVENIKKLIINFVNEQDGELSIKLSTYLADALHYDYNYLSNLFSSIEGVTVEQYLIKQKIEKAKELLIYDEISLTEIAYRLSYSSLAHMSGQFKRVTGLTPSYFKKLRDTKRRKSLDKL